MNEIIKEIKGLQFGILSKEDILKLSVCEVFNSKLTSIPNTVYDERMGSMSMKSCPTCGLDVKECPGHFGHINLAENIIHPLFYKYVIMFLKCFCVKCYRMVIRKDILEINNLLRFQGEYRFKMILKKIEKHENCGHCQYPQPKLTTSNDGKNNIIANFTGQNKEVKKIIKTPNDIKNIFDNIIDEDVVLLGFDPGHVHPKNLVTNIIPVLPPRSRPRVSADNNLCDDDLTIQYAEIIKKNNKLNQDNFDDISKRQKEFDKMYFKIKSLFDNSQGKAKHSNGRSIKGIKERISGKEGIIRCNLLGKRVNQSSRTVIGPDPTLKMGEVAIPPMVAEQLTIPETVNTHNINYVQKLVNTGKANFYTPKGSKKRINLKYALNQKCTEVFEGDVVIRNGNEIKIEEINFELQRGDQLFRDSVMVENLRFSMKREVHIKIGDVVERQLQNGDYVLLNRQPTLHIGSIISHKVVIRPGNTFRFNLATCASFNADFDGDEMNVHSVSTLQGRTEMEMLSSVEGNFMSPQSSNSNMKVVQDALLGIYLMTKDWIPVSKQLFSNIVMIADGWDSKFLGDKLIHMKKVYKELNIPYEYTGRFVFSMMLPDDFNYTKTNKANQKEPTVKIYKGVLYEGTINKQQLSGGHYSILHLLYKEYNVYKALQFINNVQFISGEFLLSYGFSIGIFDCLDYNQDEVDDIVHKGFAEADEIEKNIKNDYIREVKINGVLGKTKDIGMNVVKDKIDNNNFISTITSGSKGSIFNISQITSLLGQQNINGDRIMPQLYGGRTLPHYSFGELDDDAKYESKGFIKHSFIRGLDPEEFFFHGISGRTGVIDTSMKTASSGYAQRKIIKVCEDLVVKYDGSVRNANNKIIQFKYGCSGLDPKQTIKVDDKMQFINLERIVDKMNTDYENKLTY